MEEGRQGTDNEVFRAEYSPTFRLMTSYEALGQMEERKRINWYGKLCSILQAHLSIL